MISTVSVMFAHCNPFAHIYCHAHEILRDRESSSTISDSNDQIEANIPYIVISPFIRMRLIEGGDRRTHNLQTIEIVAATVIQCGIAM